MFHDGKKLLEVEKMLETYKSQHSVSASTATSDEICNRSFIVQTMQCGDVGNILGAFLHVLCWAVVYNTTILIDFQSKLCDGIAPQSWVPLVSDANLVRLSEAGNCSIIKEPLTHLTLSRTKNESADKCYIDECFNAPRLVYIPAKHLHHNFHSFNLFVPRSGRLMGPVESQRADVLFGNTELAAKYSAKGFVMNYFLEFTAPVLELTQPLLRMLPQYSHVIGLHVRHQKLVVEKETLQDERAEQCMATLFSPNITSLRGYRGINTNTSVVSVLSDARSLTSAKPRKCAFLVATDRASSLVRLSSYVSNSLGCDVLYTGRATNLTEEDAREADHRLRTEHGQWSGVTALADIYLLGHAHVFIGTVGSTFSQLPANLVAARAMRGGGSATHGVGNPILVIDAGSHGCLFDDDPYNTSSSRNKLKSRRIHTAV